MAIQFLVFLALAAGIPIVHSNSAIKSSWDPTLVNPCTWFHVTCNADNSVVRVDLGNTGLSGRPIPQLSYLRNLQYLEVYGNNLTGSIPKEIGNLKKLVSLDLYENKLSGEIPASLGKLKSLRFMRLNSNKLTGSVPVEMLQLITLGNLQILDVWDNLLAGTIRARKAKVTTIRQDPKVLK